jgi:crossover junction endodeoxyribonuclease RuvC
MGVGVVEAEGDRLACAHACVLRAPASRPLAQRLLQIYLELVEIIERFSPCAVAIEEPFVAKNARAAMAVGQAQAIAMLAAARCGAPVASYAPRAVKQAVTDFGGSSKAQVQEMVGLMLGLDFTPALLDATDALATAICHVNSSRPIAEKDPSRP